jgi:hypothetical protein
MRRIVLKVSQYTKVYPFVITLGGKGMKLKESLQPWLVTALDDPVAKILSKNSHLTKTQLETLLIDILSENMAGKTLRYDEKASLRLTKAKISRGAFNRTAAQAKTNVIRSIYTVLLLGYLGIFESTVLDPYLEIADKLRTYVEAYKTMPKDKDSLEEHVKLIKIIRDELETSLRTLSVPSEERL